MRKFILSTCIIICIVIVIAVIYNNNLTIEQKIGSNQEFTLGFKKRDVSNLEKYAIQEGFEYIEQDPGYQFNNFLFKEYNSKDNFCKGAIRTRIYDGSPYKIQYSCSDRGGGHYFVYDFKNNSWYTNANLKEDEKVYAFKNNDQILLPYEAQEIFDQEFKDIHEEIKNGVKNFKEE